MSLDRELLVAAALSLKAGSRFNVPEIAGQFVANVARILNAPKGAGDQTECAFPMLSVSNLVVRQRSRLQNETSMLKTPS